MEKQVNELISKGWRPKAGMTAGANGVFYQAMVSEDVKKGNRNWTRIFGTQVYTDFFLRICGFWGDILLDIWGGGE